jgi:hypothetical protein
MKKITKIIIVSTLLQSAGIFCCKPPDDRVPWSEVFCPTVLRRQPHHAAQPKTHTTLPSKCALKYSSFKNAFSLNRKTLLAATALTTWWTAEAINAKRELNKEETYQKAGFFKKSELLAGRTAYNIVARPFRIIAGIAQIFR